jgi:hypothetical protein
VAGGGVQPRERRRIPFQRCVEARPIALLGGMLQLAELKTGIAGGMKAATPARAADVAIRQKVMEVHPAFVVTAQLVVELMAVLGLKSLLAYLLVSRLARAAWLRQCRGDHNVVAGLSIPQGLCDDRVQFLLAPKKNRDRV